MLISCYKVKKQTITYSIIIIIKSNRRIRYTNYLMA